MSKGFKTILIITTAYGLVSVLLFFVYGVKHVNDSHRYIEYAATLQHGFYFDPHNFWYLGYALFIFLVNQIQDGELAIVIAQYVLSWLAVICIYKTAVLLFKNENGGIFAALLYILFIELLTWNSYILCESLYCSLICFSLYLLASLYERATIGKILMAVWLIPFTVLTKPTGIALLCALLVVLIFMGRRYLTHRTLRYTLILLTISFCLVLANRMLTTYRVMENYELGEIVYGISTLHPKPEYDLLSVVVPNDIYLPPETNPPLVKIVSFMAHNPIYWTKLFLCKTFYLLVHIRPYWSVQHNIFSIIILLPLYYYAIRSLIHNKHKIEIALFFLTYVLLHVASIGITSVDWDGRFLMPLLPAIFIMASTGMAIDFNKIFRKGIH